MNPGLANPKTAFTVPFALLLLIEKTSAADREDRYHLAGGGEKIRIIIMSDDHQQQIMIDRPWDQEWQTTCSSDSDEDDDNSSNASSCVLADASVSLLPNPRRRTRSNQQDSPFSSNNNVEIPQDAEEEELYKNHKMLNDNFHHGTRSRWRVQHRRVLWIEHSPTKTRSQASSSIGLCAHRVRLVQNSHQQQP